MISNTIPTRIEIVPKPEPRRGLPCTLTISMPAIVVTRLEHTRLQLMKVVYINFFKKTTPGIVSGKGNIWQIICSMRIEQNEKKKVESD